MVTIKIDNEHITKPLLELADRLKLNPEAVIELLVQERIARDAAPGPQRSPEELVTRWMKITDDLEAEWEEPWKSADHGELLYDEYGLPK